MNNKAIKTIIALALVTLMPLALGGCKPTHKSKEELIRGLNRNREAFETVAEYTLAYDLSPYMGEAAEDEPIFIDFAQSDYRCGRNVLSVECGTNVDSTFYKEEPVEDKKVIKAIKQIIKQGYASIVQVNAKDDRQTIDFYMRDTIYDDEIPHGIMFTQHEEPPANFQEDWPTVYTEHIDGNWYYYEMMSWADRDEYLQEKNEQ